jgi:cytochrome c oxidase subunit 4
MVLDSKQMEWASREGLDTAALKKARVPIFGKWYFPDLPANVPLVNLSTGEVETFPAGYRAGAVLYVKEEDLKRAGLGPYKSAPEPAPEQAPAVAPPAEAPPEASATEPVVVAAAAVAAGAAATAAAAARPAPAAHAVASTAHHEPSHAAPESHGVSHAGDHAAAAHAVEHAHPGSNTYIMVASILAVITAIEVWVYYVPAFLPYIFPILIVLSAIKFTMVVGWFMHLKFDHISYTWYFGGGLALAMSIVLALIVLQIATHGLPPGDGHAEVYPSTLQSAPASAPAEKPAGGH